MAPYQRQIRIYQQNESLHDILNSSIEELNSGYKVYA